MIAFNRVRGFRDGISLLEGAEAVNQQSIDIYGNDISQCGDDGIEADFSMGNVRVHHNRVTDCFIAISSQPSLGGPTYFYRNVVYNAVYQAFKPQRSSVGDVIYHNTVVKVGDAFNVITEDPISRAMTRNNIFIGGPTETFNTFRNGEGRVVYLPSADATNDFDYDGFGSIGTGAFSGEIGTTTFNGLAQLRSLTSESNAVQLDLSVFASPVTIPANPVGVNAPPNLELVAGGAAIDRGEALAGFNDGFTGNAPDLGAYELGKPIPVYGVGGNIGTGDPTVLGDFDGDGDVDLADLDRYNGNIGAAAVGALVDLDLNGDGTVGANDFALHYTDLVETSNGGKGTFAGDINLDGTVDVLGDAFALIENLNNAATSWAQGDLNADGTVDVLGDAFALIANLGNANGGGGT